MALPFLLKQIEDTLFIQRRGYEANSVYVITWSLYNGYGVIQKVLTVEHELHIASEIAKHFEVTKLSGTFRYAWANAQGSLILVSEDYQFAWECVYLIDKHPKEVSEFIQIPWSKFVSK